jgi:tRNA pseudouridine38-40 synthase
MRNIKLIISYDGTNYLGWQCTPVGASIESTLQSVLEQILQQPVSLQAASRTDAGVHAHAQVVNFMVFKPDLNLKRLEMSLNGLLPKDMAVLLVEEMALSFHPTLDCREKEYRYYICMGRAQSPQNRFYSWHVHAALDLEKMGCAAQGLIGSHDFSSFCNVKKNASYSHFRRQINAIEIEELESNRLCVRIRGNNFLYKMVRNLVGTLVYIGKGKIDEENILAILDSRDRTQAGVTAPAHGLFLHQVFY